jgi:hypothetical protein
VSEVEGGSPQEGSSWCCLEGGFVWWLSVDAAVLQSQQHLVLLPLDTLDAEHNLDFLVSLSASHTSDSSFIQMHVFRTKVTGIWLY